MEKVRHLFVVVVGMFLLFSMTNSALADTAVTARHQLISETEIDGGFRITLSLTMQNAGTEALSNVTLEIIDPMFPSVTEPGEGAYFLGYLPSGTDVQFYWDITSAMPMIDPMLPMLIMGTGMDAAGNTVEFSAFSEGIGQ